MTPIPDFSTVAFADPPAGVVPGAPTVATEGEPWLTPEGIPVKAAYGPQDRDGLDVLDTFPGLPPYLRGPYPTMYVNQPWTVRQYAGFSTAEDSNAFYRRNLAAGQKGLSVAFDLATHRGYDFDHPRVSGDVGMAGVAIDSIYDMRTLFAGIPLDRMTVSMTMNGAVLPVLALYIVAAEEQGVPPEKLSGTIQNDILKEFMVRNTYIYPPGPSMRIIGDIFAFTSAGMPKFNSISISGYHMQEAGATQDLELAYTLADGVEYIRAGHRRRADRRPVRAAPVLLLGDRHELLHGGRQAARRAPAVGQAGQGLRPKSDKSLPLRTHSQTSRLVAHGAGRVQQRRAHLRRGDGRDAGAHAVAAHQRARRGAGAAHRTSRPASPATRSCSCSRRAARRGSIDPWGGSYYVERLTHELARKAWGHIEEVEGLGGMAKAIEAGIPKLRIEEAAARTQARIDSGLPDHRRRQPVPAGGRAPDRHAEGRQRGACARCRSTSSARLKAERDRGRGRRRARGAVRLRGRAAPATCSTSRCDAARAKATVGEISDALERSAGATGPRSRRSRASTSGRSADVRCGRARARPRRGVRGRATAAGRASSSPRWARTGTTAARR